MELQSFNSRQQTKTIDFANVSEQFLIEFRKRYLNI